MQSGISRTGAHRPGRAPGNFPWFYCYPYAYGIPGGRLQGSDRFAPCQSRNNRIGFTGYDYMGAAPRSSSNWHGIPGVWEMMPGTGGFRNHDEDI